MGIFNDRGLWGAIVAGIILGGLLSLVEHKKEISPEYYTRIMGQVMEYADVNKNSVLDRNELISFYSTIGENYDQSTTQRDISLDDAKKYLREIEPNPPILYYPNIVPHL